MQTFAIYNWDPAAAPVNIDFVEPETFGDSGFPAAMQDDAFVTTSGPTYASGAPGLNGKRIVRFVIGANENLVSEPQTLVDYVGTGKAAPGALAAGPDGLYFSDLYKDDGTSPLDPGATISRVRYVGHAGSGGTATSEHLYGTARNDTIAAGGGDDMVVGRSGNDHLSGQGGDDTLLGGRGLDRLHGDAGRDSLIGGGGRDFLSGGGDSDRLEGGSGPDRIVGGEGSDTILARDGSRDRISCGPGSRDRAVVDRVDVVGADCERRRRARKPTLRLPEPAAGRPF